MQNLIVLGLIPGTHIQITFALWLIACAALLVVLTTITVRRSHLLRNWMVTALLLWATQRSRVASQP